MWNIMVRAFFLVLAVLLLCGAKPISLDTYQKIDHGLELSRIQDNPDLYQGSLLLVGGQVLTQLQSEGGGGWLLINPHMLDSSDRPVLEDTLARPFWASLPGAYDESLFEAGRMATLAGEVVGRGVPGPTLQSAVILYVQEIHPWLSRAEIRHMQPPPAPYWYDPWYDPWCPYPYGFGYRYPYRCW